MSPSFEWDGLKARENVRKHRVNFDEASSVLSDPLSITNSDTRHSADERRHIDIGMSALGRVLVVVYTERGSTIRIISARTATKAERTRYEEATA
ncbi:MAG: BrnT family toxin [Candidatus Hydrogenedentes bacterium]|nr:BrnT family toxin [Candidatus Hydrogenedentota bacterium]